MRTKLMSTAIWTVGRALALQHRGFRMMSTCSTSVVEQPIKAVEFNPVVFPGHPPVQLAGSIARLNAMVFGRQLQTDTLSNSPVVIMHGLLGNGGNFRSWGEKLGSTLKRPRQILALGECLMVT